MNLEKELTEEDRKSLAYLREVEIIHDPEAWGVYKRSACAWANARVKGNPRRFPCLIGEPPGETYEGRDGEITVYHYQFVYLEDKIMELSSLMRKFENG